MGRKVYTHPNCLGMASFKAVNSSHLLQVTYGLVVAMQVDWSCSSDTQCMWKTQVTKLLSKRKSNICSKYSQVAYYGQDGKPGSRSNSVQLDLSTGTFSGSMASGRIAIDQDKVSLIGVAHSSNMTVFIASSLEFGGKLTEIVTLPQSSMQAVLELHSVTAAAFSAIAKMTGGGSSKSARSSDDKTVHGFAGVVPQM